MTDDITLNKTAIIRRCLQRVDAEFQQNTSRLDDFTVQDAIVLNLLRACESAIDLAMHHVADRRLGIPQHSREAFELLMQHGLLTQTTTSAMKNMVGFRNIAVHSYQQLQRPVLEAILLRHLGDFETYLAEIAALRDT
ncbi:MAG: DUF86 domain-containing protein [Verrucomicrobia bacterium]|jgi:uncharacterized protein YutE (UPF0331/DUF86 family)|nr:DUF86 domain-containing protein [Verrucomicrobiota bacterium]